MLKEEEKKNFKWGLWDWTQEHGVYNPKGWHGHPTSYIEGDTRSLSRWGDGRIKVLDQIL